MNPNKALWEKGDFTRLANNMRASGDALVESLGVKPGVKVLDLGCGDGTTALPAAQLRRRRARRRHRHAIWSRPATGARRPRASPTSASRKATPATCSSSQDDSFDLVVSMFGAMFAPKPFEVAKEMVRVTRPGGRIVMGNWIPGDPTLVAQILKISSAYSPPPPEGFISPMTWGVESNVLERFDGRRCSGGRRLLRARHLHLRLRRHPGTVYAKVSMATAVVLPADGAVACWLSGASGLTSSSISMPMSSWPSTLHSSL